MNAQGIFQNPGGNGTPSIPTQVPLSGRPTQTGSVTASQSTAPEAEGQGSLQIRGTVRIEGAYSGSVPTGNNTGTAVPLRLDDAVKLGLRYNLGAISENNAVRQAEGLRKVARSALLPQANTVVSEVLQQLNLQTIGVQEPGFPTVVGPFNYFDARAARVTGVVFDFVRLANLRSARENLNTATFSALDARNLVVLAIAGSYLELIATNARIASAIAQVRSSQAVYQQAVDRLKEGLNARIDTTRTRVQLQIDQQRLRSLEADRDRQKLRLARLIGLPLGQQFNIEDDFPYLPLTDFTLETALLRAYHNRPDLQAADSAVRAAEASLKASRAERLPSLTFSGDYGATGLRPTTAAHGVFTVVGTLTIPLYQGGRVRGEIEQAEAALHQRQAEAEDLRGRIDQDVRDAFIDLNAAADQVSVAGSNVELAEDTMRQARDRFIEGVADTVEVVMALQSVVVAHDDYISAVFAHNLAKAELARAMGDAERTLPQLLPRK